MATAPAQKSTTVRFDNVPAVRFTRYGFRVLRRVAPGLAVRLATRLWCTPPRRRGAASAVARPPGGHRLDVLVAGRPVAVETWTPPGCPDCPAVYLVHGWGGRRAQLDGFVGPLLAAGYRVVSFDGLSHGESARGAHGRQSSPAEMASTLTAVVAALGPAYGVVAHSIGGSATALAVLDGLPVGRLVLVAPLADPPSYTREFARALGLGEPVRARLVARVERMVGRPVADFNLPDRLRAAPVAALPPLLLIHDRDDKEARYADAPLLVDGWPESELLTTGRLGHRRILRDPAVVSAAVSYLNAGRLAPVS
jgi:pimeloyl-ACP methyl ester carboxylesterase